MKGFEGDGDKNFDKSNYTAIDLSSFSSIEGNAFRNSVTLASDTKKISIIFENNTSDITVKGSAFESCKGIENIVLPKSGKFTVDRGSFYQCVNLKKVLLPVSGSNASFKISAQSFENCTSIETISLPNGTIDIGDKAFFNCKNLTAFIPSANTVINSIGTTAFF
jgi:hypothetical protein